MAASVTGIFSQDTTLINGRGRFPGEKNIELSVVNVQQGKRYRFHVISMSCDPNFTFSIDGHNLIIIETDSIATSPHTVDSFQIFTGILLRGSLVIATNL